MLVACSIVGNPMICGRNDAGAGPCAAALAPVTVPFPLESTPGSSSEHSSIPSCLGVLQYSTGSLRPLSDSCLVVLHAFRAPFFFPIEARGVAVAVACMHACMRRCASVLLPRRVAVEGTWCCRNGRRRRLRRARPGIATRSWWRGLALNHASARAWGSGFGLCGVQGQRRGGQRLLARGCRSA